MSRASTKPVHAVAAAQPGVAAARLRGEAMHPLASGSVAPISLACAAWMAIRPAGPAVGPDPHAAASRAMACKADRKARTQ